MKLLKGIATGLIILVVLISAVVVGSYVNHRIRLNHEDDLFTMKRIGDPVSVNSHNLNIYSEGSGEQTLVFLSGGGTSSPVLDFRSLYTLLTDDYRIAVVEKAGYGFSEVSGQISRDVETILSETRQALQLAGIEGPYILCPHSVSGIEALYWAQEYPEEVTAIIGLDMAVPTAYEDYNLNMPLMKLASYGARIGITRLLPGLDESDAIRHGTLTDSEQELYRTILHRRTATKDMLNEVREIKNNARKVDTSRVSELPVLLFHSDGTGTGWTETEWRRHQTEFALESETRTIQALDCPHYVHNYEYDYIAEVIRNTF